MNRKALAISALVGASLWTLVALSIYHHTRNWSETGQWMVIILVGVVLVGAVWLGVERDQQMLDEKVMRMREDEAYGFEEDESTPPRAA